mmetsp:Transcript_83690/g.233389  ORF Transcript_83690/g.233389 Transcript_83690/m.233389 type:complete len:204 (-) Transcript_83690:35-646(-)
MSFLMLILSQRSECSEKITMRPNHCSHGPCPSKVAPCSDMSGSTSNGTRRPGGKENLRATPPRLAMGSLPADGAKVSQPAIPVNTEASVVVAMSNVTDVPAVRWSSNATGHPAGFSQTVTRPLFGTFTVPAFVKTTLNSFESVMEHWVVWVTAGAGAAWVTTQFGAGMGTGVGDGAAFMAPSGEVTVRVSRSVTIGVVGKNVK